MKNQLVKKITAVTAAMVMTAMTLAGCGSSEAAEEAVVQEEMDRQDQIEAVQDTLTFMGGLKTVDTADKNLAVTIFRNDQGSIIFIYAEDDEVVDYGMYETEDATTADGRTYSKIMGGAFTYGYYFNDDLNSGIIVDSTGEAFEAAALDEVEARVYVNKTL